MSTAAAPRPGAVLLAIAGLLSWVTWLAAVPATGAGAGAVEAGLVLALAAAALVAATRRAGLRPAVPVPLARTGVTTRAAGPPETPGRVTDPTHHPLRPRAPGAD